MAHVISMGLMQIRQMAPNSFSSVHCFEVKCLSYRLYLRRCESGGSYYSIVMSDNTMFYSVMEITFHRNWHYYGRPMESGRLTFCPVVSFSFFFFFSRLVSAVAGCLPYHMV